MELTKYEHACFTVEKDHQIIVVDPGEYSTDFISPSNVVAIVITHEHQDHFDHDQIAAIIDKNPEAIIIGPGVVTASIEVFKTKTVAIGDNIDIGPFKLEFFGGQHAIVHPSIPPVANLGVMINDLLYYPGDSFVVPSNPVDTLALPVAAPWLKASEVMDYLVAVHPRLVFPTHDKILSIEGQELADARMEATARQNDIEYKRLTTAIEI